MSATAKEEAIRELEGCKGRFVTVCFPGTDRIFSGEAIWLRRENGTIELDLVPVPMNKWARPHQIKIHVCDFISMYSREAHSEIRIGNMIITLKENCGEELGGNSAT